MTIFTPPKDFKMKSQWPCWVASSARMLDSADQQKSVTNKYTNEDICKVSYANADVVKEAIAAAHESQEAMRTLPSYKKKEILSHIAKRLKEKQDEFAYVITLESGKPIKDAKVEISRAIDTFQIAAEEATRIYGEYLPLDISEKNANCQGITKRFPVGAVSLLSPWNFPVNLLVHSIAPAIAAGCPFVAKPASSTPITSLMLGEILAETDLPRGAFSIVPCGREASEALTTDDRIKALCFTGSTSVGWNLKAKSGKKRTILELGGNAPCIVDKEVEMNHVAGRLIHGGFYQGGQSCISVQRVYIHEHIFDRLVEILVEKANKLKCGNPLDEETFIGPLISEDDAKRCYDTVQEAVKDGAEVLCGGEKPEGAIFKPTIVTNVNTKSKLFVEEIFGPVIIVEKVDCFKDAVEKSNNTKYGLQAGVFSKNIHHCYYAFDQLQFGGVVINDVPSVRVDSQPYGGIKDSGIGRVGVKDAIHELTEVKIMLLKDVGSAGDVEQ